MAWRQPYTWVAPLYDLLSLEWPVYRAGRLAGIEQLGVRPGARVLDLGCGTGLNFPLLQHAVGPTGGIVGVDTSAQMLRQARARVIANGWSNVTLLELDVTRLEPGQVRPLLHGRAQAAHASPGVLATYALSLMDPWREAFARAVAAAGPGARVAVVDMTVPRGAAAGLSPLARLACRLGGADICAHPWSAVEEELQDVSARSLRGGHIQVRAGTVPRRGPTPG